MISTGKFKVLVTAHSFIEKSGVDVYTENLFRKLCPIDQEIVYVFAVNSISKDYFKINSPNIELAYPSKMLDHPVGRIIWYAFFAWKFIKDNQVNLVFNNTATGNFILTRSVPIVSCLHDLAEFHLKRKYSFWKMLYRKYICLQINKFFTDHFIAVSENTKKDMVRFLHIPQGKITVIPNGADHLAEATVPNSAASGGEPYLLYVGRMDPYGKNVVKLVEAFKLISDKYVHLQLYLVGNKARGYEKVIEKMEELGIAGRVKLVGYVDAADLSSLYANATLFVFPSLYEGFGFPVLESMKFGVPVVCSGTSSLPEIGGDAAIYFNPESAASIAGQVELLLENEQLRNQLKKRGPERYREYTWQKCAAGTYEVINRFRNQDK